MNSIPFPCLLKGINDTEALENIIRFDYLNTGVSVCPLFYFHWNEI